jgi:putative flippase GtrA
VSIRRQIASYSLVGVMNTLITAITIVVLTLLGVEPVLSNAAGFGLGLLNSFIMNKRYTFQSAAEGSMLPFLVSFAIAYGLNLVVLVVSSPLASLNVLIPQAAGMLTYNVVFFVLMKLWVFAGASEPT